LAGAELAKNQQVHGARILPGVEDEVFNRQSAENLTGWPSLGGEFLWMGLGNLIGILSLL
jgi:hypothetical protein